LRISQLGFLLAAVQKMGSGIFSITHQRLPL
jgi:hypothetical protein